MATHQEQLRALMAEFQSPDDISKERLHSLLMTRDYATLAGGIPSTSNSNSNDNNKPTIIGIYGLPGSGKTTLLNHLRSALAEKDHEAHDRFNFFEGSEMIARNLPEDTIRGIVETMDSLPAEEQAIVRAHAIDEIVEKCHGDGKPGIVTGHFIFWDGKGERVSDPVMGEADLAAFTHILYLQQAPQEIARRCEGDGNRKRAVLGVDQLEKWQDAEMGGLRKLCRENAILFTTVSDLSGATKLVTNFVCHDVEQNEKFVAEALRVSVVLSNVSRMGKQEEKLATLEPDTPVGLHGKIKTMLVIDADKTLAPQDAGELFWKQFPEIDEPLKELFSGPLKYSYTAFRQAALLYEQVGYTRFEKACSEVAPMIKLRPEFKQLLGLIGGSETVGVVVATCGIKSIWNQVLRCEFPGNNFTIIGGNSIDEYVVTPETKAKLVTRLRDDHKLHVCAIGDSLVDVGMLTQADMSFVVVGPEEGRSKSVEPALLKAFKENGLRARQILFPPEAAPRLTVNELPKAPFGATAFLAELEKPRGLTFVHATDKPAAKLLAADSRNVDIHGLNLHRAHRNTGWYLATEYVSEMVGVEAYDMQSVQGKTTDGHRLRDESKTCIVPLMRGGEPMARGVWEAFPAAMFVHAKEATDVQAGHLQGKWTVVLVDAVINSGKSVVEFVRHIREKVSRQIRIVVVAGVVQEGAVAESGMLRRDLVGMGDVSLVALRVSSNKFAGVGGTDTGHRLFNSTHLD